MYYRFTKIGRNVIYFNVILTIILGFLHLYNAYRLAESNDMVKAYMAQNSVTRNTAIRRLVASGEPLMIGGEFVAYYGIFFTFITLLLLYHYAKHSGFMLTILVSLSALVTNFIGGIALLFVVFTGRNERQVILPTTDTTGNFQQTDWQQYINRRTTSKK